MSAFEKITVAIKPEPPNGHIQRNKAHLKALKAMNSPEAVKAAEERNRKRLEEKEK